MSRAGTKQSESLDVVPLSRAARNDGAATALWLGAAYLAALVIGFVIMRLPGATVAGNELSFERTLFTVTNAATGAGFGQNVAIDQYGALGKACVVALMTIGTLLSLIIGGLAVVRVAAMPYSDAQIIRTTIVTYVLAVFAGLQMTVCRPHLGQRVRTRHTYGVGLPALVQEAIPLAPADAHLLRKLGLGHGGGGLTHPVRVPSTTTLLDR